MRIAAASWSGGKDSYLALHTAHERGERILYTIHMMVENIVSYHGPLSILMTQQASMGTLGVFVRTSWEEYERDFKSILRSLRILGVDAVVFGDIYIEDHRRWVEKVCSEIGLEALEPLWGIDSLENVLRAIRMGVKAMIIRVHDTEPLRRYVGRLLDQEVVEDLVREGIDPSGERGEYHTLVLDAPLFKYRIEITEGRIESIEGRIADKRLRYRIYVPTRYRVISKHNKLPRDLGTADEHSTSRDKARQEP